MINSPLRSIKLLDVKCSRCNLKPHPCYKHGPWLSKLYAHHVLGIKEATNMNHIKTHYFTSHQKLVSP